MDKLLREIFIPDFCGGDALHIEGLGKLNLITGKNGVGKTELLNSLRWKANRFTYWRSGEGKFFCWFKGLQTYGNSVLLINEFEYGMHHSVQDDLWSDVFKLSEEKNIQVFATTHSLDTIRSFTKVAQEREEKDVRLIRLEKYDGEIMTTKFDLEDLKVSIEELNLDPR